jgi:hypothetical protein
MKNSSNRKSTKNETLSSIKKKKTKAPSKKKQRALTKSAKVMIEKMNNHTTEDDIMNIMMSMETNTDTKAVEDDNKSDDVHERKDQHGLRSLQTDKLKNDQVKDERVAENEKKLQSDIAKQLKMIDDFSL